MLYRRVPSSLLRSFSTAISLHVPSLRAQFRAMAVAEYTISTAYFTPHTALGEGPTFVPQTNELYYVDIHRCQICAVKLPESAPSMTIACASDASAPAITAYEPWSEGAAAIRKTTYSEPIGVLALLDSSPEKFLVGGKYGFAVAKPNESAKLEYLTKVYQPEDKLYAIMRVNDGNVDPTGEHFFAGTMEQDIPQERSALKIGTFYRYSADGSCTALFDKCQIPNGLVWTSDNRTMFWNDSPSSTVWKFDYDVATGTPSNRQAFITIDAKGEVPDGMTISAQDDLFIAIWGGSRVEQRDSTTGALKAVFKLPGKKITCPTFGGPGLEDLFVTSAAANEDIDHVWTEADGLGGEIFRFKVPGHHGKVRGVFKGIA
ncbi:SMP-30/Gluconolaconase/LRE-like region-domain-containing protein [Limtongia smithiae]|uniref:SMP-30/Gluconolaconase/LRE-like region-domain-containing protein n=1 Tax=Limtongia smithiae TaxID=1125753 RepID=UPI0034CF3C25